MPLFRNAVNPTATTNVINKNISQPLPPSKSSQAPQTNNNNKIIATETILIPSFFVRFSQSIISFILHRSSNLPFIGTDDDTPHEFEVDEYHIILAILFITTTYYTSKYRKLSKKYKRRLHELIESKKMRNFETIVNTDDNNVKRIECLYYKNELQLYDIDLLTRNELRSYIHQILDQCNLLSDLSIKILAQFVKLLKQQQFNKIDKLYDEKIGQLKISSNGHLRSNRNNKTKQTQQKMLLELRNRKYQISESFDPIETKIEDFETFFDDKAGDEYLMKEREKAFKRTEKEIIDEMKLQNERKNKEILNEQSLNKDDEDAKMTEVDDETAKETEGMHKHREKIDIEMMYDHNYLVQLAHGLPIEKIDFSTNKISPYNVKRELNQLKYDIILNENRQKKSKKIKKYAVITTITAATIATYWYHKHYKGKPIGQYIRETKAKCWSYIW